MADRIDQLWKAGGSVLKNTLNNMPANPAVRRDCAEARQPLTFTLGGVGSVRSLCLRSQRKSKMFSQ
jgi:hypothetical protein